MLHPGDTTRSAPETAAPPQGDVRPSAPAEAVRPRLAAATVCHLIASNFVGGPEKQILEHVSRLQAAGWRAVVGSFRENRDRVGVIEAARERGLPTFLVDTRSPFSPLAVPQLRRQLRLACAGVLVTHGYKANLVGYLATRASAVVQIPYVRGYTAETRRIRAYEVLDRRLLRLFPRVLCVSHRTKALLAEAGVPPQRIHTVHNAVRDPGEVTPSPLRQELGIPGDAPLVVAAGRLSVEKAHRFLIDALAALPEPAGVHAVICGEGRELDALRSQAAGLGIAERVHFPGFRRDLPGCLAAADLVVNPSLTEGLPNVVLEAMALGTPVAATDVGGVSELIRTGETGWLVPAGDPAALARAMGEALADPGVARARAARARELAHTEFSVEHQTDRLLEIYDEALLG